MSRRPDKVLANERAAVSLDGETPMLERDRRAGLVPRDLRGGRAPTEEVDEPHHFATASPQPFLPELAELDWRLAQRVASYRPRQPRRRDRAQQRACWCLSPRWRPGEQPHGWAAVRVGSQTR